MHSSRLLVSIFLFGCGSSSTEPPDGSVPDASSGNDGGADVSAQDAPSQKDGASDTGAPGSDSGGCSDTPGTIACADAGACSAMTQVCCGPVGPPGFADSICTTQACLAGGIVAAHCDDTADCSGGQICCVAPNTGSSSSAQWVTQCQTPLTGPNPPCGENGGDSPYEHLCSCEAECGGGGPCGPGTSEATQGRTVCPFGS